MAGLGDLYATGSGVPRNLVLAHLWFNLATVAGEVDAARKRDILAKQMTPAQVLEAQKLALEWRPTYPELNSPAP